MEQLSLQKILQKQTGKNNIKGIVVCVQKGEESWLVAEGNLLPHQPYFIASTTKLYVTALVLNFHFKNSLHVDDPLTKWLPSDWVEKLHVFKGIDYSNEITIRHLLSQTSGLADYFEDKHSDGILLFKELLQRNDQEWDFSKVLDWTKQMKPRFKPGQLGKAHYSDSNFQLLEQILERVTAKKLDQLLTECIIEPLNLKQTYLYQHPDDATPAAMNFKNNPIHIPLAMKSVRADGGIISTATEQMIFLKAFFSGYFFPKEFLTSMYQWNRVMFPLEYGLGIMRFKLPGLFSPFRPTPEFIGHSGISGAFAFYNPEKQVFLTGTVNQIHNPGISFRLMMRILNKC